MIDWWHWTWGYSGMPDGVTDWGPYGQHLRDTFGPGIRALYIKTLTYDSNNKPVWVEQITGDNRDPGNVSQLSEIVKSLSDQGISVRQWAVIRDDTPQAALDMADAIIKTQGVLDDIIIDLEPYGGYWDEQNDALAEQVATKFADADMPVALCVDARSQAKLNAVSYNRWLDCGVVTQVHPMCYWTEFGDTAQQALTTAYNVLGAPGWLEIVPALPNYPIDGKNVPEGDLTASLVAGQDAKLFSGDCSVFRVGPWAWSQGESVEEATF